MVMFKHPRYEVNVYWDNKDNAECPLNCVYVRKGYHVKEVTFKFFKQVYWCEEGGEELNVDYFGKCTPEKIISLHAGLSVPLYMNRNDVWDLSISQNMTYNTFIGIANLQDAEIEDGPMFLDEIKKALKEFKEWGNGHIIGAELYKITGNHDRGETISVKVGWYLEDLEEMICYLINDSDEEISEDAYVNIVLPTDMEVE